MHDSDKGKYWEMLKIEPNASPEEIYQEYQKADRAIEDGLTGLPDSTANQEKDRLKEKLKFIYKELLSQEDRMMLEKQDAHSVLTEDDVIETPSSDEILLPFGSAANKLLNIEKIVWLSLLVLFVCFLLFVTTALLP